MVPINHNTLTWSRRNTGSSRKDQKCVTISISFQFGCFLHDWYVLGVIKAFHWSEIRTFLQNNHSHC
jgi:hypothetical protein